MYGHEIRTSRAVGTTARDSGAPGVTSTSVARASYPDAVTVIWTAPGFSRTEKLPAPSVTAVSVVPSELTTVTRAPGMPICSVGRLS